MRVDALTQVTIGVPVFNGAKTLRAALDSLLAQSYRDFVLIISDNGSTDTTEAICREYAERDARVSYYRQPQNLGAALNFRYVLFQAKSPYFMWAAADDQWAETFIQRNLEFLEAHDDFVMSQSRVLFTVDGQPSHLSTGTYAITGAPAAAAVQYFTNPADNSRYYGLFRTSALQAVFPPRNFHALDWAVSAATLRYGKHHEIPDVLMIRDSSDAVVYEHSVLKDHKFILWRVFPSLFMTRYIVRQRLVPLSPGLAYALLKLNLYLHFRFGLYRWKRMGDLYVQSGNLQGSLLRALAGALGPIAAPGLRQRLRRRVGGLGQRGIGLLWRAWSTLPFTLQQRLAIHRFVTRRMSWLARRVALSRSAAGPARSSAAPPDAAQSLAGFGWQGVALPAGVVPDVSVILIAANGLLNRLNAIDALVRSSGMLPFEIVVIDRGPIEVAPQSAGLVYRRLPPNSTFADAANVGAVLARGDKLVFVDGSMLAHMGFLEHLLAGLATAALIAPQVRTSDRRLYSAGGRFNALFQPQCVGYQADPAAPRYQVSAEVNFCCGAFAIRRKDLLDLGPLDPVLATLEVASAELAMRLHEQGKKTRVRPRAVLTVTAQASGGSVSNSGVLEGAEWQPFLCRRRHAIAHELPLAGAPAATNAQRRRVLFIDAETPMPDQNSGSNDALNMMLIFIEMSYQVTFIPESNFSHRGRYTDDLLDLGIGAVWFPYHKTVKDVLAEIGAELSVVVLCRGEIATKYIELVRVLAPRAKIIFNAVDLHFLRMEREAELSGDGKLRRAAAALRLSELDTVRKADATIVVSSYEQTLLENEVPQAKVHLIPLIRDIPNALDVPDVAGRKDVIFVGTYQHPPNRDAAMFFAKQIFPLIRKRIPNARFLAVGSEVTPEIQDLAGEGVEVLGYVQDLDALLRRCRVSVAPLRYGAGIKGKVATALQSGLPTVASTVAVEGTPLVPDREIVVADDPDQFAAAVIELYLNDEKWRRLSEAGFQFARQEYSLESNRKRVRRLFETLDIGAPAAAAAHVDSFDQPSKFWGNLQVIHAQELSLSSVNNFKRSLNNSYFQWLPADPTDNQFRNLFNFWNEHFSFCPLRIMAESQPMPALEGFKSHSGDNPFIHVADYWQFYTFFVGLLWHFVSCHDPDKLHERLEEPAVGNPLPVRCHGKLISQDLAHSIYEHGIITSLSTNLALPPRPWVLEIGAGYGRLAYVFHKARRCKYIIVDIPPARGIAQWYLPQVLNDVKVFHYRPFDMFSLVAEEFEAADICFLSPSQIEKLPDGCCDIGISISSLHEMTTAQITHYKMQFERLTKHLIYFAQWAKWTNPADQIALTKDDYLMGPGWEAVLDRSHPIQSDFVQLAFRRQAARRSDEAINASEQLRKKALQLMSAVPEKPTHSNVGA